MLDHLDVCHTHHCCFSLSSLLMKHELKPFSPGDHDGMARMKDIYSGAYSSKAICEAPHRARGQLTIQETGGTSGQIHVVQPVKPQLFSANHPMW